MKKQNLVRLIDKYTDEPLYMGVERIKKIRSLVVPGDFILGFCACKKEIFPKIVDYMAKVLDIPRKQSIENIDLLPFINKGCYNLSELFKTKIPHWNSYPNETVLVTASGFEHMPNYRQKSSTLQVQGAAHLFTQNIKEDDDALFKNILPYYTALNKVVVLCTHIGHSLGKEIYHNAVIDANRVYRQNRYQDFNFEVEE